MNREIVAIGLSVILISVAMMMIDDTKDVAPVLTGFGIGLMLVGVRQNGKRQA